MLCTSRTRGTLSAAAWTRSRDVPPATGSTWTTTSLSGQRALERRLDGVGGRVPLRDCGVRRDADDDVDEVAAGGLAQAKPAELDRRLGSPAMACARRPRARRRARGP